MVNPGRVAAYTLIETLVVMTMVAVLLFAAFPVYENYLLRTRRQAVSTVLLSLAVRQEAWRQVHQSYTDELRELYSGTESFTDSEHYRLQLNHSELANYCQGELRGAGHCFVLSAHATGRQLRDHLCAVIYINHLGLRGAVDSGGQYHDGCW